MKYLTIDVDGITLKFACMGGKTESRVASFWTKEPDTVAWIRDMKPGEVFLDIGANVGMYSILAGALGLKVRAVEPESLNFATLNTNIFLNKLADNVVAFPVAISGQNGLGSLHLSSFDYGRSLHTVDLGKTYRNKEMSIVHTQGTVEFTLDDFVAGSHVDHIKVDVDGLDDVVVRSGWDVVKKCKSILVEIDTEDQGHQSLVKEFSDSGFYFSNEQVARSMRTSGPNKGMANHIFHNHGNG